MSIEVLFSDKDIAVCLKPPGLDSEHDMPRLLSEQLGIEQVLCVHRLDRETGGLMVYALNGKSAAGLSKSISRGELTKVYLAVAQGRTEEDEGSMEDFLFHDRCKNKSYTVKRMRSGVKTAKLNYLRLFSADGLSLYRIWLITGRTHQIRCQFASRSMPLVGDRKYGGSGSGLALFAESLSFPHPADGRPMCFNSPPPGDFPLYQQYQRSIENG